MQYPAANAHPFEFARLVLLLAALAFFAGFGGYLALNPTQAGVARATLQAIPGQAPATQVSAPVADPADRPEKT